jgi:hypothetical protein
MRKFLLFVSITIIVVCFSSEIFAGGRNLNVNQSGEYCKTLNRIATNDTDADRAYFNPAGTALVPDGLYLYLSNQIVIQPISIKPVGGHLNELAGIKNEYKAKKYGYMFPNIYLNYKKDRFAWSFGFVPIGGGGSASYPDGLQQIDATLKLMGPFINGIYSSYGLKGPFGNFVISKFDGSSAVYGAQSSFAYAVIKDKLSLSVGYRFEYGDSTFDGKIYSPVGGYYGYIPAGSNFHATQRGMGHGIILGISAKPMDDLTVTLRGEWMSQMRLKTNSRDWLIVGMSDSSFRDGMSKAAQSPANLNAGIAYRINGLQLAASFIYFFNQFALWNGKEEGYTGGYDLGFGLDYTFKDFPLNIGAGYLFNNSGARPSGRDQMWEELNAHNVSAGLSYSFLNNTLKLTVAELLSFYTPEDVNKGSMLRILPARVTKTSYNTAIGISYKAI